MARLSPSWLDFSADLARLATTPLASWAQGLPPLLQEAQAAHGNFAHWLAAIEALPPLTPKTTALGEEVRFGESADCDEKTRQQLAHQLQQLHPWRKGPFSLYGLQLDTEWRSDWKWSRFAEKIAPLVGRTVLDVGCGNGYYLWRMMGAGAALALGLDPFLLYALQFQAIKRLSGVANPPILLPLGLEALPTNLHYFDTVFSLGVFYHRPNPFEHLFWLRDMLRPGGQLVLETLIIAGDTGHVLVPPDRYAQMRNVWFIPSVPTLQGWLAKAGFTGIELLDITPTTSAEQRSTPWMRFHSLSDFLQTQHPHLTNEGHPAPIRATFSAIAPPLSP